MSKNLQTLNGQNELAPWAGRISECRNSGMAVKTWCRENGINEQIYYKRQRRLFEVAQAQLHTAQIAPGGKFYILCSGISQNHSQCRRMVQDTVCICVGVHSPVHLSLLPGKRFITPHSRRCFGRSEPLDIVLENGQTALVAHSPDPFQQYHAVEDSLIHKLLQTGLIRIKF